MIREMLVDLNLLFLWVVVFRLLIFIILGVMISFRISWVIWFFVLIVKLEFEWLKRMMLIGLW